SRAAATSGRSCSLAYTLFFEAEVMPVVEAPDRRQAHPHATLCELGADLRLLLDKSHQPIGVLLEHRAAMPAHSTRRDALLQAPALQPFDRNARAYPEQLRRRAPRGSSFHVPNNPDAQIL